MAEADSSWVGRRPEEQGQSSTTLFHDHRLNDAKGFKTINLLPFGIGRIAGKQDGLLGSLIISRQ